MIIDVPNCHWLVDENRGGCSQKALKNNRFVCLMIDGINQLPAPIFTKRRLSEMPLLICYFIFKPLEFMRDQKIHGDIVDR